MLFRECRPQGAGGERAQLSASEYLERAFRSIREAVKNAEAGNLKAVVVFGSAVRPEDFVIGLSDIDVLAITGKEPSRPVWSFTVFESDVEVTGMQVEDLKRCFELGVPLALMLYREGVALEDDGTFASIVAERPSVTERTFAILRGSVFAALGLAFEAYLQGNYRKSVSHAYHAARHLARHRALKRASEACAFPLSDREVKEASAGALRDLFAKLVDLRRLEVAKGDCREALEKAVEVIASELGLKAPSLSYLESNVRGEVVTAVVMEVGGSVVIRVEALTPDGPRRLEVGAGSAREIRSLFE